MMNQENKNLKTLKFNLDVLFKSRSLQITAFLERDTDLFETILNSEISEDVEKICHEKMKCIWMHKNFQVYEALIQNVNDLEIRNVRERAFSKIYKELSKYYINDDENVDSDMLFGILRTNINFLDSLEKIGINGQENLKKIKLQYRIDIKNFNKLINNGN